MDWGAILKSIAGVVVSGLVTAIPVWAASDDPHLRVAAAFLGAGVAGGVLHQLPPPAKPPG